MRTGSDQDYRDYNLPGPLEVALRTFGKWSDDQLQREQAAVTPRVPLFHYTGREALKGILENQYLWCFSHDQQDDVDEFRYSLAVAGKELQRVATYGEQLAKEFCNCVVDLIAKTYFANVFNFFLFSVSQNRDCAVQWERYGRNGTGFSIGFAPKLFLADQPTLSPRANENSHVGLVVYGDEKTTYRHRKVIERAAEITHRVATANRNLLRRATVHSDYINAMAKEYIARQLIWRCVTAKRSCWSYQSEIRFVIMNQTKNFEGLVKTHNGRRYITHPLPLRDPGSIAEIMVGRNAPSDAEHWVRQLLASLGYPAITVTRSLAST
jgi:hypothetical protein